MTAVVGVVQPVHDQIRSERRAPRVFEDLEQRCPGLPRGGATLAAIGGPVHDGKQVPGLGLLGQRRPGSGEHHMVLVERAPKALAVIRENVAQLGIASRCRVVRGDATTWLDRLAKAGERFDLIFVDPPYASGEAQLALDAIARGSVLAESGAILVESAKGQPLEAVEGLRQIDEWLYGDTVVARWSR